MTNTITGQRLGVHRRAGFTAIEVSAVATIIAILALVLIPIMSGRVEQAKVTAAQDDMLGISKAQMLAHADTGAYFRLQDLGRPAADKAILADLNNPARDRELARVPNAFWNVEVQPNQLTALANKWTGPQLSVQNYLSLPQIAAAAPYLVSDGTGPGGPILFLGNNGADDLQNRAEAGLSQEIRYPVDPWGNPYLFFGTGRVSAPDGVRGLHPNINQSGLDTDFGVAAVYSLGPDGLPGVNSSPTDYRSYYRDTGGIGPGLGSDDLVREF